MRNTSESLRALFFKVSVGLIASSVMATAALAADYYIDINDPNASDQNPGTEGMPWKTIQKAGQVTLSPGDNVFVKAGVYSVTSGGVWSKAAITPQNSGAPGNPITFKSVPKHAAIIDGGISMGERNADDTQALIGTGNKSYIVIDGFIVRNAFAKGVLVFGDSASNPSEGNVIQNNIITNVTNSHATDNTDAIRIEYTDSITVRNNLIYNIHNGTTSCNAAGVKLYGTSNSIFENNEVYDAGCGIIDKRAGRNNIIRRNYLHDVREGIMYKAQDQVAGGDQIYENVISRTNTAIFLIGEGVVFDDVVKIFNNVFSEYRDTGVRAPKTSVKKIEIYNNIFHRTGSVSTGDIITFDDPANTISFSDFNIFTSTPVFQIGRYLTNKTLSLNGWSSNTAWDTSSQVGNVSFVDAGNDNFRLNSGSIALGAGRIGGVGSGANVNIGAYTNPSITIGVMASLLQPKGPVLESVVVN